MIFELIKSGNVEGVRKALSQSTELANEPVPFGDGNPDTAHPLHRICDAVFEGKISDGTGVEIAKVFLDHGAKIDGNGYEENKDTPLIAAASLNAENVGILYVDLGAELSHGGCRGGTALHWAAWTGCAKLVKKLIEAGAPLEKRCADFNLTPLGWALHGRKYAGDGNREEQTTCAKLLIDAGAQTEEYSGENLKFLSPGDAADKELIDLLKSSE